MGLSRRRELYYKEIVFDSLAELFLEYKRSYERVFHTLKRVKARPPRLVLGYTSSWVPPRLGFHLVLGCSSSWVAVTPERVHLDGSRLADHCLITPHHARPSSRSRSPPALVGLPLSHEVFAGENICWSYISVKVSDVNSAAQLLSDHGRTCNRLHEQVSTCPPPLLPSPTAPPPSKRLRASGGADPRP